jgi:hypothetical protein
MYHKRITIAKHTAETTDMSTTAISKYDDVIDSRDVIERIEELKDGRDAGSLDKDEKAELAALLDLQAQCEGYVEDWEYGAQLIRDSYFKCYAMEIADDTGAIDDNATWPQTCIDWDQAARELQMDYTAVDFDGVAYWVR